MKPQGQHPGFSEVPWEDSSFASKDSQGEDGWKLVS